MNDTVHQQDHDITVLVAVAPHLVAELISDRLDRETGIVVTSTASTSQELAELAPSADQDVVCVDPRLVGTSISTFTRTLGREGDRPSPPHMVMVAGSASDLVVKDAVQAGCSCFASTDDAAEDLVAAVRAAFAGEPHMDERLLERLTQELAVGSVVSASGLTEREQQVLSLTAQGMTARRAADQLGLSVNTVRHHIQSVLHKLGVHSKVEAIDAAVRAGIIPPRA